VQIAVFVVILFWWMPHSHLCQNWCISTFSSPDIFVILVFWIQILWQISDWINFSEGIRCRC